MKSIRIHTLFVVLCFATVVSGGTPQSEDLAFKQLSMRFEVNETDGDGEVVFSVKAPEGLSWLKVFAPGGEVIIFIMSNDERVGIGPIGLAQFRLETGEPSIEGVKRAYPEGTYQVLARTISGGRLFEEVDLSHALLPAPSFSPEDEETVDPDNAVVKWNPVEGAFAYEVEIENDDLEVNVTATLPGSATSFEIPRGFLRPGTEYDLGVTTVTKDGNLSVAESSFVTAE